LLFVTSFYPPATGGGSSRIYDFSRLLAQMGFEVTVLAFSPFRRLLKTRKTREVNLVRIPTLGFKHPLDQIFSSFIAAFLIHLSKAQDFTIASVPMGEPCIGAFLASSLFRRKIVVDVRDEWEDAVINRTQRRLTRSLYRLYRRLFNAIYRKSVLVITVTPTLVKRVKQRGVRNVHLLPNGADTRVFKPIPEDERMKVRQSLGVQEDDFVIVYAGRVGWYYRIDVVIRGLHLLVNTQRLRNVKLLVVGSGERVNEYLRLSRSLKLEGNVIFLGEKRREELARILPACDLGVVPFDDDPIWLSAYTTKIFEYCASRLPVVVSVKPGADLERLVGENGIGFVTEPMNPEEMAEAIFEAYRDEDRLSAMRQRARRLAVEKFDRQGIAKETARILESYR